MNHTRLNIFTGHFGSGKTEFAINFAIYLKKYYNKVSIVDLDIVNPYFRTKDAEEILIRKGIKVIAPTFANTNVDVPILPSEIISVFQDKDCYVVFDVGGDETGAVALGRYYQYFSRENYRMFFVINSKRPLTDMEDDTIDLLREVEKKSRLRVTDLINNTNLSYSTTIENVLEGQKKIENISREINVPITYISGTEQIIFQLPEKLKNKAFPMELYLKMLWEQD